MISTHSITTYLQRAYNDYPDKTAIVYNERHITYRQLFFKTEQFASFLIKNKIKKNNIIGVKLSDSIEFAAILFAASSLGVAIAPIDKTIPAAITKQRFDNLGVNFAITDENLPEAIDETPVIDYPELDGNELFILSLTSGSTSEPKSIELTQNIKIARAKAHIDLYSLNEEDVILSSTPLYHSLAERLLIMSVMLGSTLVIIDDFKPHEWFKAINNEKVTFTIADSSQLAQISQMLLSPFIPDISSLRAVVSSSSYLENHVKKELINRLHCKLYEIYGTSETSTLTNIELKNSEDIHSVGTPLNKVEIRIDNADEKGIGEIICKTPLMFKGYYGNRKLTESSYINGFFKTGDLGKIDENGSLHYNGRKDEMIKVNGINIYPIDIETILQNIPEIEECAVFTYPDDLKGNTIGAAIVKKASAQLSHKDVVAFCNDNLPLFSRPEHIFFLPELPKNQMGKVMKNKIYEKIIRLQMTGEL